MHWEITFLKMYLVFFFFFFFTYGKLNSHFTQNHSKESVSLEPGIWEEPGF